MIDIIEIDNLKIEYERIKGKRKDIIFVHGALGSFRFYKDLIKELGKDYNVYAISLPGMGKSGSKLFKNSFSLYVSVVKKFIRKLELDSPILIGHSLGGAVLSKLIVDEPNIGENLIIINSAGIKYDNFIKRTLLGWFDGYIEFRNFTKLSIHPYSILPYDIWNMMRKPFDAIQVGRILKGIDLTQDFPKIKTPTLILWGSKDRHIPIAIGREIQKKIPKSKFTEIKQRGHNWVGYEPQLLKKEIVKFIKK